MATYVIGDIQGCHAELQALLDVIDFQIARDKLWFTGDLVNRGPASLAVLRFVKALGERAIVVLGNHDLHLLARRYVPGTRARAADTLDKILEAADCDELLDWLRHLPFIHHDQSTGLTMTHAGVPPQWTLDQALTLGEEAAAQLRAGNFTERLRQMYGDFPNRWDDDLRGDPRFRFIVNAFTRLRYVDRIGCLELKAKGAPGTQGANLIPWYAAPNRHARNHTILFGHWSTLRLSLDEEAAFNVIPLDTGAVWGGRLTAHRIDDGARFSVPGGSRVAIEGD